MRLARIIRALPKPVRSDEVVQATKKTWGTFGASLFALVFLNPVHQNRRVQKQYHDRVAVADLGRSSIIETEPYGVDAAVGTIPVARESALLSSQ